MTIDSVAITKAAVYDSGAGEIRIPSTSNSGSVALTIPANPINYETRVRSQGIPLPYQGVSSVSELMLKNESGTEIDAQFDILSTWPDGSFRSVLVTAALSADLTSEKIYALDWGNGVVQGSYSSNLGYTQDASTITVSTGNARFVISKTTGMITAGYADTAGDQSYATQIIDGCELWQQDAKDDTQYSSDNETSAAVSVTYSGVMLIEIHVNGYVRDVSNNTYTKYEIDYRFYKDSDYADIEYAMIHDKPQTHRTNYWQATSLGTLDFESRNRGLTFSHQVGATQQYIFGGESTTSTGNITGEVFLFQTGARYLNDNRAFSQDSAALSDDSTGQTQTYTGVQSGNRAKGYSTVHDGTVGLTLMLADFWETWPHELSVTTSEAKIHLFPERYHNGTIVSQHSQDGNGFLVEPNTEYNQRTGMARTYRMRVLLHRSTPDAVKIQDRLDDLNNQRYQMRPTADHFCTTKAFYDVDPTDAISTVRDTNLKNLVLLQSQTNQPHRVLPYGWRNYGDQFRGGNDVTYPMRIPGMYNINHYISIQMFTMYIRTLDDDWLDQAWRQTRHFMDQDVAHCATSGAGSFYSAMDPIPAGYLRTFNHKDVDHDAPYPDDTHHHCAALVEYYQATGCQRAKRVMEEIANNIDYLKAFHWPLPRPAAGTSGISRALGTRVHISAERQYGWLFASANQYVKMTNDSDYHLNVCTRIVNFLIEWWKVKEDHYIYDSVASYSDWENGTGAWLLDQSDNTNGSYKTNGPSPFMLASLLYPCLEWYRAEQKYGVSSVDLQEFRDMLYQIVQFVNYWGYNETDQEYVYSMDPTRNPSGSDANGARNLMSPMSEIYLMYKADLAASNIVNPSWYDDATWKTRILFYGTRWENTPYTTGQSGGFYGYELLWDMIFWKNLKTIRAE